MFSNWHIISSEKAWHHWNKSQPIRTVLLPGAKVDKKKRGYKYGQVFSTYFVLWNNIVNWNAHEVHPLKKIVWNIHQT